MFLSIPSLQNGQVIIQVKIHNPTSHIHMHTNQTALVKKALKFLLKIAWAT